MILRLYLIDHLREKYINKLFRKEGQRYEVHDVTYPIGSDKNSIILQLTSRDIMALTDIDHYLQEKYINKLFREEDRRYGVPDVINPIGSDKKIRFTSGGTITLTEFVNSGFMTEDEYLQKEELKRQEELREAELKRQEEQAMLRAKQKRRQELIDKYGAHYAKCIEDGRIELGMPKDVVELIKGDLKLFSESMSFGSHVEIYQKYIYLFFEVVSVETYVFTNL